MVEAPFLVRIIDFDLMTQFSTLNRKLRGPSSKAGLEFFPYTKGNTMVDFYRFAASANLTMRYRKIGPPVYWKEWQDFVLRYLPAAFIYEDSRERNNDILEHSNGGIPTHLGGLELQMLWGPQEPSGLLTMLDDPYFEELRV